MTTTGSGGAIFTSGTAGDTANPSGSSMPTWRVCFANGATSMITAQTQTEALIFAMTAERQAAAVNGLPMRRVVAVEQTA